VINYREVEKQRGITKHRQVEKEGTVIKQNLEIHYEKVTLPHYPLHY